MDACQVKVNDWSSLLNLSEISSSLYSLFPLPKPLYSRDIHTFIHLSAIYLYDEILVSMLKTAKGNIPIKYFTQWNVPCDAAVIVAAPISGHLTPLYCLGLHWEGRSDIDAYVNQHLNDHIIGGLFITGLYVQYSAWEPQFCEILKRFVKLQAALPQHFSTCDESKKDASESEALSPYIVLRRENSTRILRDINDLQMSSCGWPDFAQIPRITLTSPSPESLTKGLTHIVSSFRCTLYLHTSEQLLRHSNQLPLKKAFAEALHARIRQDTQLHRLYSIRRHNQTDLAADDKKVPLVELGDLLLRRNCKFSEIGNIQLRRILKGSVEEKILQKSGLGPYHWLLYRPQALETTVAFWYDNVGSTEPSPGKSFTLNLETYITAVACIHTSGSLDDCVNYLIIDAVNNVAQKIQSLSHANEFSRRCEEVESSGIISASPARRSLVFLEPLGVLSVKTSTRYEQVASSLDADLKRLCSRDCATITEPLLPLWSDLDESATGTTDDVEGDNPQKRSTFEQDQILIDRRRNLLQKQKRTQLHMGIAFFLLSVSSSALLLRSALGIEASPRWVSTMLNPLHWYQTLIDFFSSKI